MRVACERCNGTGIAPGLNTAGYDCDTCCGRGFFENVSPDRAEPAIPFGYRRVDPYAPTQKGDGRWNANSGRYEKVKKVYPRVDPDEVVIRKCAVVQAPIPGVGAEVEEFEL